MKSATRGTAAAESDSQTTAAEAAAFAEFAELLQLIKGRRTASPEESYTASLLQGDEDSLLKKLAEEAAEAALAAKGGNKKKLAAEMADVFFHCFAVMTRYNIGAADVAAALRERRGQSGFAEKQARRAPKEE